MMRRRIRTVGAVSLTFLGLMLLTLFKTGCVSYVEDEGATDLVRFHNWWNFYERGTARLKEGRFEHARADFERCLGRRPGAKYGFPEDMWRARTYGLHFVEGYFPNRELGVCMYQLGKVKEATTLLETSMEQTPSGRAKHYLNLARKQVLAAKKVPFPEIIVDADSITVWTRERTRLLSGAASGDGMVGEISINGKPQFIELAEGRIAFSRSIPLVSDRNVISVEASDLLGQKVKKEVVWMADWQAPEFIVRSMVKDGDKWVVRGECYDNAGLSMVSFGRLKLLKQTYDRLPKRVPVHVKFSMKDRPVFEAVDVAGNRLKIPISLDLLPGEESASLVGDRFAAEGRFGRYLRGAFLSAMIIPTAAIGLPTPKVSLKKEAKDTSKPRLRLKEARSETEVFKEEFFLDGSASDGGGLRSIKINGKEQLAEQKRGGISSYFAQRLPLVMGENRFSIAVQDLAGNETTKDLKVIRKKPDYTDLSYRLSMGVPPLLSQERATIGEQIMRSLEEELLQDPVRFRLKEAEAGWGELLRGQGLRISDLSDPRSAVRISKTLAADMLLMGTLMRDGSGLTIYTKVVEASSGDVLLAEDVYSEAIQKNLDYQIAGLVMKLEQGFPLINGSIVRVDGNRVTIDVGSQNGVRKSTKFVVIQESKAMPGMQAGKVYKMGRELVELSADRLENDNATVQVLPSSAGTMIENGDYVYAR